MRLQNKSNGIYLNVQGLKVPYGWWYSETGSHVEILGPGFITRRMGRSEQMTYWVIPDPGVFGPMPTYYRDRVQPRQYKPHPTTKAHLIGDDTL